jgi:hypothetical protein
MVAALGIVVIVGLLLMLVWTVERHHAHSLPADEPVIVAVAP